MGFRSAFAQDSKLERALVLTFALAEILVHAGERVGIPAVMRPTGSRNVLDKLSNAILHDVPAEAAALGFAAPVHALITGHANERDRRVVLLTAPRFGIVGQTQAITFRIEDQGGGGGTAEVSVRRDGEVLESRTVRIGARVTVTVQIPHALCRRGGHRHQSGSVVGARFRPHHRPARRPHHGQAAGAVTGLMGCRSKVAGCFGRFETRRAGRSGITQFSIQSGWPAYIAPLAELAPLAVTCESLPFLSSTGFE